MLSITLISCMPYRPDNDFFDTVEIQNIKDNIGIIHYKVSPKWLAWAEKTNVNINHLSLGSLQGPCEGELEIVNEGFISYKIIWRKSQKIIFFGEENQIVCYVSNNEKDNSFKIHLAPIVRELPFGDSGEHISDTYIRIPI